ncbi:MAG: hypothetical protein Q9163_004708 [Psora crenata]
MSRNSFPPEQDLREVKATPKSKHLSCEHVYPNGVIEVHIISSWTFKPIRPAVSPTFIAKDVTVVIPTLGDSDDFPRCLQSIVACAPKEIIVVTPKPKVDGVRKKCENLGCYDVKVLGADQANKRLQMLQGLKESSTAITVFADDDVFWPTTFLTYILAAFENPKVGAAGGYCTLERPSDMNYWDFLSSCYLDRWNFDVGAAAHIDGGIPCLSGRTFAARTSIVQSKEFTSDFTSERWLGWLSLLSADDDNFITRWMVDHNWEIAIQCAKEAEVTSTLERCPKYLGQCVRWCRTTLRSNLTALLVDKTVWRYVQNALSGEAKADVFPLSVQPWSVYAVYLSAFNPPALVMDGTLAYLLYRSLETESFGRSFVDTNTALTIFLIWLMFTKTVKLGSHFAHYPSDLKFLPVLFGFSYLHGLIKAYSLLTIYKRSVVLINNSKTSWNGGRVLPPIKIPISTSSQTSGQDRSSNRLKRMSSAAEKTEDEQRRASRAIICRRRDVIDPGLQFASSMSLFRVESFLLVHFLVQASIQNAPPFDLRSIQVDIGIWTQRLGYPRKYDSDSIRERR